MKSAFTCSLQLMVSHKALLWPLCYDCTDFLKCSIQKLECEFLSLGEKFQKFVENNQYTVKDLSCLGCHEMSTAMFFLFGAECKTW